MKVEIGPGKKRIDKDWVGFGPIKIPSVDIIGSWGKDKLPFKDNSIDILYSSHVIEHIWWFNVENALKEAYRCIKPDGIIEIWTVDFSKIIEGYLQKKRMDRYKKNNPNNDFMMWINGKLFSYSPPDSWAHHSCFDFDFLYRLLINVGFKPFKLTKVRGKNHESNLGIGGLKC
jgi:predicted SAM-dependent methyltransferase